jgi:hypothetical protein
MFRITLDPLAPSVILRAISRVRDVIDADVTPYTPMMARIKPMPANSEIRTVRNR